MSRCLPPARLSSMCVMCALALAGCSSSSDGEGSGEQGGGAGTPGNSGGENAPPLIAGDIARYGVVNVAEESGVASDTIAAFYRASPSVGAAAFGAALDGSGDACTVQPASTGGNDIDLLVFVPEARGSEVTSIDAGDTVTLTGDDGTWSTLTGDMASAFNFYSAAVPDGAVPVPLRADVSAAADVSGFPGFDAATFPSVTPLTDFAYSGTTNIAADTAFTWTASGDPASRIRLVSSTAGAFFSGSGVRVSCLVPDSGSFRFSSEVRAQLGADFDGEPPLVSRVSIATEQQGDSVLFLIRESFVD